MKARDLLVYAAGCGLFFAAIPAGMVYLGLRYPVTFVPPGRLAAAVGAATSGCGLFFTLWANLELYRKGGGGPAVIGRIRLMTETCRLVTSGPYALCRNPMHLGLILFYLGLSCALNSLYSLLITFLFWIFAFCFAVFLDEPRLRRDFGAEYEDWAARVPRFWPRTRK